MSTTKTDKILRYMSRPLCATRISISDDEVEEEEFNVPLEEEETTDHEGADKEKESWMFTRRNDPVDQQINLWSITRIRPVSLHISRTVPL